jgi:hypothetical protein
MHWCRSINYQATQSRALVYLLFGGVILPKPLGTGSSSHALGQIHPAAPKAICCPAMGWWAGGEAEEVCALVYRSPTGNKKQLASRRGEFDFVLNQGSQFRRPADFFELFKRPVSFIPGENCIQSPGGQGPRAHLIRPSFLANRIYFWPQH